jgi:subtilase family serine protease
MSVTNNGDATAVGPIVVLVQAEGVPDSQFDIGVGDMAPGQTTDGFFDTLGPGTTCFNPACTVTVTVDPGNNIVESNETNNSATRTDEPPDLTVDLLFPPSVIDCSSGPSSCTLRVDLQINNIGAGISPSGVKYVIEAEGMPDLTLSIDEGGEISPGGSTGGFFVTLGPGTNCFNPDCTVTVTVDPDNDLVESDETNNTATRTDTG